MADTENKIDKYQLLNLIATSNSCQIWDVVGDDSPEHFAMKLLLPNALKNSQEIQLLKYEAKVGKSLDHPNLIQFDEIVIKKDYAFLLMELFKAPSLKAQIINDLAGVQIRIKKLFESVCRALQHMHEKGWVHKDVKPDNILMNKAGEVRVIDFSVSTRVSGGISKLLGSKAKVIQGTRTYIAPEIIRKFAPTPQSDIYSLGVTLFEVLTGKPPFTGSSPNDLLLRHLNEKPSPPSQLNQNIAPEMDRLVVRLLAKKPTDRPKSMQEISGEINSIDVFKEPIQEQPTIGQGDNEQDARIGLGQKLDSRTDAQRQKLQNNNRESSQIHADPKAKPAPPMIPATQQQAARQPAIQQQTSMQQREEQPDPPPVDQTATEQPASKPLESKDAKQKHSATAPKANKRSRQTGMFRMAPKTNDQSAPPRSEKSATQTKDGNSLQKSNTNQQHKNEEDENLDFMDELPPIL